MIALFWENLRISLGSIFANKSRSILTALGIVIGVLSVTVMGTLISGLDRSFEKSMSWLGKDILYISRWEWFSDMEWWEVRNRPRMRLEYEDKIREQSNYALAVSPVMQRGATLSFGDKTTQTQIFGTNVDYMETVTEDIQLGRFFSNGGFGNVWEVREILPGADPGQVRYRIVAGPLDGETGTTTADAFMDWVAYPVVRDADSWKRMKSTN